MRNCFYLLLAFFITGKLLAGEGEYAVSKIPLPLLLKANAVKRMENIFFTIQNKGEGIYKKKYAITIFNEKGADEAYLEVLYHKLSEVKNIEGVLYNAMGVEIKRLKNKQIIDISANDDNNLIDDHRRKVHRFYHTEYPYTIEYEIEEKYKGMLFFPIWFPRSSEFLSVQQSTFSVVAPLDYHLRFREFNYNGKPEEIKSDKSKSLIWKTENLPATVGEPYMPSAYEVNTSVLLGPSEFEIEGYSGVMNSWADFGKFINALKQGRDQLPQALKDKVKELTNGLTDVKEKIAVLYQYMQKNTRYISIQLGIGGWQPFDANEVAKKSYGDCKALTNYMYSLLKEAGIRSCYTLIKAGTRARDVIADFPSQQFNHVILSVPLQKDTMWLECTSQTLPAGYLGDFTCNRYALAVDEDGGKLVRTPDYGLKENTQIRSIKATLDNEASLTIKSNSTYKGLQQDQYHDLINSLSKEKVKEALHEQLDFPTYDIQKFEYKEQKSSLPFIEENLEVLVSRYATITGKRLFIVPNIMTRHGRRLSPDSTRKYEIDLKLPYRDTDTVEITLPEGYASESIPQDVNVVTKFGTYKCSVKLEGNKLFYYRNIEQYSGRFPAAAYNELVQFYDKMYKADRAKVVLIKNAETKGF